MGLLLLSVYREKPVLFVTLLLVKASGQQFLAHHVCQGVNFIDENKLNLQTPLLFGGPPPHLFFHLSPLCLRWRTSGKFSFPGTQHL